MEKDNMSDLLNTFKNVLNNSSANTSENITTNNNSVNISPEMINNLAKSLKNSNFQTNQSTDNINNKSSSNKDTENNSNLDFDTILKIKAIMESFNEKDDIRTNLLRSLKPYLRKSRQKKIDQYVNFFKISGITKLFKKEKGETN